MLYRLSQSTKKPLKVACYGRLDFLLDELRRMHVIGAMSKNPPTILYQSKSTLLLRYISPSGVYKVYCTVIRSSRQYFKVIAFTTSCYGTEERFLSFRNYRLTADCIKKLFKEV